jgi:hypothetical protein
LQPFRIVEHGGSVDRAVDMTDEPKLLEREFKEGAPLTEVAFFCRQLDGDVAVDVEI